MPATFLGDLLGRRNKLERTNPGKPNFSDGSSKTSVSVALHMLESLGIEREAKLAKDESTGRLFERLVRDDIKSSLNQSRPNVDWQVRDDASGLAQFAQYSHLGVLESLVADDETNTLAMALGQDYEVKPDVTVALPGDGPNPFLHATVSCKFTIRSDRAQNVRTESAVLTRHRKGRMPHVMAVTAEPLPTRIASLAQGTGDLDAVYHVALDSLYEAVAAESSKKQIESLDLLIGSGRLLDYDSMLATIAL